MKISKMQFYMVLFLTMGINANKIVDAIHKENEAKENVKTKE